MENLQICAHLLHDQVPPHSRTWTCNWHWQELGVLHWRNVCNWSTLNHYVVAVGWRCVFHQWLQCDKSSSTSHSMDVAFYSSVVVGAWKKEKNKKNLIIILYFQPLPCETTGSEDTLDSLEDGQSEDMTHPPSLRVMQMREKAMWHVPPNPHQNPWIDQIILRDNEMQRNFNK